MKKLKCNCQYYDEVTGECAYHGQPITPEMVKLCDIDRGKTTIDYEVCNKDSCKGCNDCE